MSSRRPRGCAEVSLHWGDDVLLTTIVRPGGHFRMGPDPEQTDFAIPCATRHSIRVDRRGRVALTVADSSQLLLPNDVIEKTLGPLTLSVRCTQAESRRSPLSLFAGARRDVAIALAALAYGAIAASAGAAQAVASGSVPLASAVSSGSNVATLALRAVRLERAVTPPAPILSPAPPARPGAMIYPETPGPRRMSTQPRLAGRRVLVELADYRPGGTGERAKEREGPIGNPLAPALPFSWAIRGARDNPRPHPARWQVLPATWAYWGEARGSEEDRVLAPWGEEQPEGRDESSVVGDMYSPEPGDPLGAGLGVAGGGPGGGGSARGIGLGAVGALGHGNGPHREEGVGVPDSATPFAREGGVGTHTPRAPALSTRVTDGVVGRVLGRSAGRLRACATSAQSVVELSFVVGSDGTVSGFEVAPGSGLAPNATRCLSAILSGLVFLPAGTSPVRVRHRIHL